MNIQSLSTERKIEDLMTTTWTFHEPGVIPGVPGQFANCRVVVSDDGTLDIQPLAQQPHLAPASDAPTADDTVSNDAAQPEQVTAAATPE
jgi:hypothetical protein